MYLLSPSDCLPSGQYENHLLSRLTALERTFLGYLRTSLALVVLSVILAQLFRLQHTERPDKTIGYFVLGIPLASVLIGAALVVQLLGTYRFWRQQNAMLRGKFHAGGWELNVIGVIYSVVFSPKLQIIDFTG